MHGRTPRRLLSLAAAAALFAATVGQSLLAGSARTADANAAAAQAEAALVEGKTLLRRNRAAEAMPRLESALALFTQAGDLAGAAAARDQIGDVFQRYGQYQTALDNYRGAYDAFCGSHQQANANLMLVKIGETGYLAGDSEGARAAFARMNQCGTTASGAAVVTPGGDSRSRGAAAFIPASAALSLASCPAFSPDNNSNNNSNDAANNTPPNEPTLGHGPTARNPSVRMDLRVIDQDGNPVKGVKAKLESERGENGLLCDCTHITDAAGKVLMDPIHLTRTLKLTLQAKGFEPLQLSVDPSKLNQPYRAVMQAKGAAQQGASAASQAKGAAQQARSAPANPASCFDLYRFFVAYGFGELGAGRADYDANNLTAARTHYENVLNVSDEKSPAAALSAARLFRAVARTSLGDIAQREGRFNDAARLYAQAIEAARKDNRLELAWAAQRGLGKSLWAASAQVGDAAAAARAREDALKAFRDALATVETLFAGSPRADEARTNFLASTRDLFDDAVSAFAEAALDATTPAPATTASNRASLAHAEVSADSRPLTGRALDYAAEAFRASEQGRARSLLDLIGESRAEISSGVPADLLARRADNVARQQEIADLLRGVRSPGAATPQDTVAKLEAELERLGADYNSLENQLRVASPRYNALVRTQPLTLAEVQQQVLDDGTALVEYFLGSARSHLFVVTKSGLTLHRLPARSVIDAQVVELRKQLVPAGARRAIIGVDADAQRGLAEELKSATAGRGLVLGGPAVAPQVVKAYADAAGALYNTVLAPAAAALGSKRLVVAADGALSFVPFEALVTAPGGADYASLNYLVKTNEIVYAPSASVVAAVRQARAAAASARTPAGGVLVVADPVFEAGDARAAGKNLKPRDDAARRAVLQSALGDVTSLKTANLRLVRLAGTRSEAEQIAALARDGGGAADVWLDLDASEANVRTRALEGYRVLHFATHGLLDTERPQFTGLALSVAGDGADDGFLRVDEVFNLRLGSPLVVLSACETGLGRERRGEGVIGLTRAFMYAGAPTVGVSLWSVADRSTAELMPDFYKRYLAAQGRSPAAALRAAQQQMIASKRYSAPFYWAPFVLVGDWK